MTDSDNVLSDDRIESVRFRPDFPSDQKRTFAALLFSKGMGYRTVARVLGLSIYTVRDWSKNIRRELFPKSLLKSSIATMMPSKPRSLRFGSQACPGLN